MFLAFTFLVVIGAASFASAKQTAQIPKVIAVHVKPSVSCAKKISAALQAAGCHVVLRTDVQTKLASMCSFQIINSCDYSSAVLKANGFLKSYKVNSINRPEPVKITPLPAADDKANGKSFNPKTEFGFDITGVLNARTSLNLTGEGIKVAIVDSGIYYLHPALGGGFGPGYKVAFGYDLVGDNYDGTSASIVPDSDPLDNCSKSAHGTHVAGIVAADATHITTPGFVPYASFTGVAPGVTLGAYRVLSCFGTTATDVVAAAVLRAAQDGADVINLSLGGPGYPDDVAAVAAETVSKAGHIVVAANGNDGDAGAYTVAVPAASAGAIGVANFEYSDTFFLPSYIDTTVSQSSAVGLTSDLFLKPDIGAVGSNVYSTISPCAADYSLHASAYAIYSGTSMSSPYVAGCIALLLQKRGKIGFDVARAYLQNTATITNLPDTTCTGTNKPAFHSPAFQGAGLVHIYKAATTGTLVTPSSLSLNDTANRKLVETIRIQNNYRVAVTFTLSHVAGATVNTFNADDDFVLDQGPLCRNTFPVTDVTSFNSTNVAKVKYANATPYNVTIKARKALNVSFQIIAPIPATADLWSLYGGYIVITNSFDIVTHIPYAGVAGKWKDRPIWSRNSSTLYDNWGLDYFNGLSGLIDGAVPGSVGTGLYANKKFTPLSKLQVVNASKYGYVLAPAASSSRYANITITYLCSNVTALKALGLQRTNLVGLVDLSTFLTSGVKTPYLRFSGGRIRNTYYNLQGLSSPRLYGFDGKVFKDITTTVTLPAGVYKMDFTAWKNFGNAEEVDVVTTPPFQLVYKTPLSKPTLAKCPV